MGKQQARLLLGNDAWDPRNHSQTIPIGLVLSYVPKTKIWF